MTPKEIRALVELMVLHGLTELEIERSGTRVRLCRQLPPVAPVGVPGLSAPLSFPKAAEAEALRAGQTLVTVEAPMVGTFFQSPAPDTSPYVDEGDVIKVGQALCIIEAMKLMNEIESKVAGRIMKILVENGQPVEYGQPLFLIEPVA